MNEFERISELNKLMEDRDTAAAMGDYNTAFKIDEILEEKFNVFFGGKLDVN